MSTVATIILAAGESARMGSPKQLLRIGETSLIRHTAECALAAKLGPVFVILGARAELIKQELQTNAIQMIFNESWKEGMHTSIRCGIESLEKSSANCAAVILMNCDQPHVSPQNLEALAIAFETGKFPAIASQYADTLGTPALFSRELFARLKTLKLGGAKSLLRELGGAVHACDFPGGEVDLDTTVDYAAYLASNNPKSLPRIESA